MGETHRLSHVLKLMVLTGDVILLNICFCVFDFFWKIRFFGDEVGEMPVRTMLVMTLCYLICNYRTGVILHQPVVRAEQIVVRVLRNMILFALLTVSIFAFCDNTTFPDIHFLLFYFFFTPLLIGYRLSFRCVLKQYRKRGGDVRKVVLVGSSENMQDLYHFMTADPTSGYRIIGYFDDFHSKVFPEDLKFLGQIHEVINYLEKNPDIELLYCSLSSERSEEILSIIDYCENHLVRFFNVPNAHNYLKRRMFLDMVGNVPILSVRSEPLLKLENRVLKRICDIIFSFLFLCTVFPFVYLIIGLLIKWSSSGPVFVKQRCYGEDGHEFERYRFRSVKMKKQSDSLTDMESGSEKTRIGEFICKRDIDKYPQFINVLKGDMSVVGPRPHMLKQTKEYSACINRYMVRYLVKPGITGWAQINGVRGEVTEQWRVEERVRCDIWYIEHWTFMLDVYIVYRTIRSCLNTKK